MKKVILNLFTLTAIAVAFSSCSDDDDHGCQECHLFYITTDNEEVELEIGEFCDEALHDVEDGYTLGEDTVVQGHTFTAGEYTTDEIHCEDHGDHEDHE